MGRPTRIRRDEGATDNVAPTIHNFTAVHSCTQLYATVHSCAKHEVVSGPFFHLAPFDLYALIFAVHALIFDRLCLVDVFDKKRPKISALPRVWVVAILHYTR
jgi:hypothetical protein